MIQSQLKIGMKVYHPIFRWGTVILPPNEDKTFVLFDFEEVSYYIIGVGYKTFKKENGDNGIYLPNCELYDHVATVDEIPEVLRLKMLALNATIKLIE